MPGKLSTGAMASAAVLSRELIHQFTCISRRAQGSDQENNLPVPIYVVLGSIVRNAEVPCASKARRSEEVAGGLVAVPELGCKLASAAVSEVLGTSVATCRLPKM